MRSPIRLLIPLILFLLIVPAQLLLSQNRFVHGKVINSKTNAPVSGVKVSISGTNENAITNQFGEYSIKIADTLKSIILSGIEGMTILETKMEKADELNVYASESNFADLSIEELLKVKVTTAGKQEQVISEVPASVIVITRADIEAYGYQSLNEILANTLGMYKIDDYRSTGYGVRGFFSNVYNRNIVFMINGIKQQSPYLNWNDLNIMNIQVETIERIECVRGPVAIIYGNDAFFGAINIITHEEGKTTKSSLNTAYGSNNTYRGNLQVNSAKEKTTVNFSAGYLHSDGRNVPFNKILDSVQRYDNTWIKNGTTKHYFLQNSAYINASIKHEGIYANLSYDESDRNLIQFFAPVYDTIKLSRKDDILRGRVGFKKTLSKYFTFDVNTTFQDYMITNRYEKMIVQPNITYAYDKFEIQKMDGEALFFIDPMANMNITLGANYSNMSKAYDLTDVPQLGVDRHEERLNSPVITYGTFLQVEYSPIPKLRILAGVRTDKQNPYQYKNTKFESTIYKDTLYWYNYDKTLIIPRAALVYSVNSKNILKLMYSQAISRPGAYENSYISWQTHPTLIPQTISTTELNYSSSVFSSLNISINVFHNELKNLINRRVTIDATSGQVITENNNTGKLTTNGGEIQLIYQPIKYIEIDASLSYQKTQNLTLKNEAAYSPHLLAYLKVIYNINKRIIIGLNSYYVGSMLSEWDESPIDPAKGNYTPKGRISKTTPGYFNLGMNVRVNNLFHKGIYFSIHGVNLLNSNIFYAPTNVNRTYLPNGTLDAGIQINASLGVKF